MFDFHTDKTRYFAMQRDIAAAYVLPMLAAHLPSTRAWRVLEVGCAEAGVLKAFVDAGHTGVGIELEASRAELARNFLAADIASGKASIQTENIYDVSPKELEPQGFDAIILKDVIEHIPGQERMIPRLAEFLSPGGRIFFGFPPWMMPFGGHQQIAKSAMVSKVPWIHLLPAAAYRGYVKLAGERTRIREELEDIRSTRITIERFERIVRDCDLTIDERKLWLFNPIYAEKFGIPATEQFGLLTRVPILRNFVSTAAYYVVSDSRRTDGYPHGSSTAKADNSSPTTAAALTYASVD